ncbi:hypothetical protein BV898_11496 [Hypsibius exemplaris]|uniref:BACK domain-containing protein n=1 Tax=Hypsibius exemplaris TaxID=2072580 RepID=A0A1W0WGD5_HYPEX|nr:hypothetical protein BV898_11496 [Hypsibius exemplaris]
MVVMGSSVSTGCSTAISRKTALLFAFPMWNPKLFKSCSDERIGLTLEIVMETLYCAKKYIVLRLVQRYRDFVLAHASVNANVPGLWFILQKSQTLDEQNLKCMALRLLCIRAPVVLNEDGFLEAPEELIRAVLAMDELCVPSENLVYQAARRWAVRNSGGQDHSAEFRVKLHGLIGCVRLPLIEPSDIASGISKVCR